MPLPYHFQALAGPAETRRKRVLRLSTTAGKILLLCLGLAGLLTAADVNYNPAPTTQAGWTNCGNYPGYACLTTAYFNASSFQSTDDTNLPSLFVSAFDAWNATQPADAQWTLLNGGDPGGTFNVTIAKAEQFVGGTVANADVTQGGAEININLNGVLAGLPALTGDQQIVWSQGLYINYTVPAGTIVAPYYTMDTCTLSGLTCGGALEGGGSIFYPPAYPYQYGNDHFYDQPLDVYMPPGTTQAFFNGDAFLSIEDADARTLTVYDGVSYGWQNYISPEPSAWLLFGSGIVALLLIRWRGSAKASA